MFYDGKAKAWGRSQKGLGFHLILGRAQGVIPFGQVVTQYVFKILRNIS